jgi:pectin lyase
MKAFGTRGAAAWIAFTRLAAAQSSIVTGTAMGFASGVTGGGSAATVYPTTIAELISYLTDSSPRNIVISGTFNFVGSEGTTTLQACNAYVCTPSAGGQALLNTLNGCGSTALYDVTIDTAGYEGINVASDKTLVGTGTNTVLNGKGLRFVGVSNIIVQNIAITNLNPQYVWGGDALTFSDTNQIWIDHVTTSSLGRQHYAFGEAADNAVTISHSFINGVTDYSATCDGHTYWGLELVGSGDLITFYGKLCWVLGPVIQDFIFTWL